MQRNPTQTAKCPLCREPIEIAEVIDEPKVGIYQRVEMPDGFTGNEQATGAGTMTMTLDMLEANGNSNSNRWGTHLSVSDSPDMFMTTVGSSR